MTECIGALCKIEKSIRKYETQMQPAAWAGAGAEPLVGLALAARPTRTSCLLSFDAIREHQAHLELYDVCAGTLKINMFVRYDD